MQRVIWAKIWANGLWSAFCLAVLCSVRLTALCILISYDMYADFINSCGIYIRLLRCYSIRHHRCCCMVPSLHVAAAAWYCCCMKLLLLHEIAAVAAAIALRVLHNGAAAITLTVLLLCINIMLNSSLLLSSLQLLLSISYPAINRILPKLCPMTPSVAQFHPN